MKTCLAACVLAIASATAADPTLVDGPFKPSDESLKQYECPEWFRDAKFGIWSHWGPQAVPRQGDWYARKMYVAAGSPDRKTGLPVDKTDPAYTYHNEHYGHPSKFGYKDIIPLWKAEKWNPDELMALYKKAGAKYFVSMGVHHDNFFLWDSKLHNWNSVKMGPKKDVVGTWQAAARKQGLRFGVSEHLGASYTWYQASHQADASGPMQGVPYDGNDPQYQDLYHPKAAPGDRGWLTTNTVLQLQWFDRIKELVDTYQPDLLYSDSGMPFGDIGRSLIAHLYNQDMARHGGKVEAVYNCKQESEGKWVRDIERGVAEGISPEPWQTDTSIGDWYYRTGQKYKTAGEIIHMLADIVSKNGNLLINIVQTPEGDLEPDMLKTLEEIGAWIAINGEAIYATRPWQVFGEGPTKLGKGRHGGLNDTGSYQAADIRFTRSKDGKFLYAIALGWPENGQLVVRSLAAAAGKVTGVSLLGHAGALEWRQEADGLVVRLPAQRPCDHAVVLKIPAAGLTAAPMPEDGRIRAGAEGGLRLRAADATLHGDRIRLQSEKGHEFIAAWDKPETWASWLVAVPAAGFYEVNAEYSAASGDSELQAELGDRKVSAAVGKTPGWLDFQTQTLGRVEVAAAGTIPFALRAKDPARWRAVNVRSVTLTPVTAAAAAAADAADAAVEQAKALGQAKQNAAGVNTHPDAQWFPEAGMGLFIHWGVAAIKAKGDLSWCMLANRTWYDGTVTPNEYYASIKDWHPEHMDFDRMLRDARAAGFTYAVLVTKHHDGFTFWPSAFGDIGTKYSFGGRDFVKEFTDACRKHGLKVGYYYSPPDWWFDRNYRSWAHRGPALDMDHQPAQIPSAPADHGKKREELVRGQVTELLTKYGRVDLMWFDGGRGEMPNDKIRALQPGVVINRRNGGGGDYGDSEGCLPGRRPNAWFEANLPCWPKRMWSYVDGYGGYDAATMLTMLSCMRSWGGNLLANTGPKADGSLHDAVAPCWSDMAKWMEHSRVSVMGVKAGPWPEKVNLPVTMGDGVAYVHFLPHLPEKQEGLPPGERNFTEIKQVIPPLPVFTNQASWKGAPAPSRVTLLRTGEAVPFEVKDGALTVTLPDAMRTKLVDVVKIEFAKP